MTQPEILTHRNGSKWVIADDLFSLDRPGVRDELGRRIGAPVMGFGSPVPSQSSPGPGTNYQLLMTGFSQDPANAEAMRRVLRAHGNNSPELTSDAYVRGQFAHLIYTEQVRVAEVTTPRDDIEGKVFDAIQRSYKYMPAAIADRLRELITPTAIALFCATLAIYAAAHFFGVGFIVDLVLAGITIAAVGTAAVGAFLKLIEFYNLVKVANTEAQREQAARLFADVVLTLGVSATAAILMRRPLTQSSRAEMEAMISRRLAPAAGDDAAALAARARGVVAPMGENMFIGPVATMPGRALNLTEDNAFVIAQGWDDAFFVAAHATESSRVFWATATMSRVLEIRAVAVAMWRAGYRGGDVVLVACESGINRGLVTSLYRELTKLGLDRPVGAIFAPRRALMGNETLSEKLAWETFSFN